MLSGEGGGRKNKTPADSGRCLRRLTWLGLTWLGLAWLHVGRCLEYRVRRHVADTNGGPEYQGVPGLSTASFRGLQP